MAPRLSAIILAAGFSSRMGGLKALLPLGTTTVLGHCITLFQDCGIEEIVVVTGHRAAEIGGVARFSGARPIYNPDFTGGMFTSVQAGVRQLSPTSDGFFLLPMDIPLVRRGTIKLLTAAFAGSSSLVAYPSFDGKRGHPPLISMKLGPTIGTQPAPAEGLRSLLAAVATQCPADCIEVAVADANILFDLDTREDYTTACLRLEHQGYPTMAECEVILNELFPMPEKGLAHGRMVAEIAVILCEAIRQHRKSGLNPDLCRVCGLLHDIAKGFPEHEQEGGRRLRELGFDRAAEIVAAHRDLEWMPGDAITEKEIVHLADKLVQGSRMVGIRERFEKKLALYREDPETTRAIRNRYGLTLETAAAIEAEAGGGLAEILSSHLPAYRP